MPNSAVIAKSRAVYGSFLKKDDYISLAHKGTIASAIGYLKTKPRYSEAFADIDEATVHREQAEAIVTRLVFENYLRICRFATGGRNGILSFLIKKLESEQLSRAVIAVATGMQEKYYLTFPPYLIDHICFDPAAASRAKDCAALLEVISGTPYYKPLKPFLEAREPDINDTVTEINCCYIKWAFTKINADTKGREADSLKKFFLHKADIDNLMTCMRVSGSFSTDSEYVKKLLLPFHRRIRPAEIDEALKASDSMAALRALVTEKKLAFSSSELPELDIRRADFSFFRRRLALTDSETEALYSLMMLFEAEAANIIRIIEGLRYALPPEEIEQYLILE